MNKIVSHISIFAHTRELWLILFLLVISFYLRTINLAETMSFTYDQGRDLIVLQTMADGDIRLIGPTTGISGFFLGPLVYYFLLPGFILSGGNPAGVAIWSAFWVTMALPFFYLILKPIVGKTLALFGYILLLINPGSFLEARIIWNPSLANMLLLPSIWCLFNFKKRPWLLIPSAFLFGLSLQSEIAYTAFLAPLYVGYVLWTWRKELAKHWLLLILTVMAFGLTLVPEIVFELKNKFLMTNALIKEMQDSSKKVGFDYVLTHRPSEMLAALNKYVFGGAKLANFYTLIYSIFIISGLVIAKFKKVKPEEWFWYGALLLPLMVMMSFRGNHGYFFDYYVSPHYVPVIACLIIAVAKMKKMTWQISAAALITVIAVFSFVSYFMTATNKNLLQYTITQEIQALKKAREIAKQSNVGVEVFVPNLLPVQYEYLNNYLGKSNQMESLAWNRQAESKEWILIWEPAFSGGSEMAYLDWRKRNSLNAECKVEAQYGIVTVEKCISN
jgi:4-amino-4-deoxy-L-arabinose transferase-like glycosyltransferase